MIRNVFCKRVHSCAARRARRDRFVGRRPFRKVRSPVFRKFAGDHDLEFGSFGGICLAIFLEALFPLLLRACAFGKRFAEMVDGLLRQEKLLHRRPAEGLLRRLQFLFAQRIAMRRKVVLLLRAAVADMSVNQDQRGPRIFSAPPRSRPQSRRYRFRSRSIAYASHRHRSASLRLR